MVICLNRRQGRTLKAFVCLKSIKSKNLRTVLYIHDQI